MSEWRSVTLADICTLRAGNPFKREEQGATHGDLPFIKVGDMNLSRNLSRIQAANNWVTFAQAKRMKLKPFDPGTVVFAKIGEALKQNRVRKLTRETVIDNNMMGAIPRADVVDPTFFYYLMSTVDFAATATGTALPYLTVSTLKRVSASLPDLVTQQVLGRMLESLDDLIENNRRRIEVLEGMARAIYREWFVKFRYPGHEDVPMVDSTLGPIPEGWAVGTVGRLCSRVQAGATPRRSTPEFWTEPSVDWYKTGDLTDGVLLGSTEKLSDAGLKAGRTFEPGTILMAIYGSPTVGRLGLLTSKASANQAALGLVADPCVCTTEYLWFKLESLRGYLNQIAQGAAQQNVSKAKVISCQVDIPPREVIESFTVRAAPSWRLSHELAHQAAALESLRDLLLPKLVTGQIDVSSLDLDVLVAEQLAS